MYYSIKNVGNDILEYRMNKRILYIEFIDSTGLNYIVFAHNCKHNMI